MRLQNKWAIPTHRPLGRLPRVIRKVATSTVAINVSITTQHLQVAAAVLGIRASAKSKKQD